MPHTIRAGTPEEFSVLAELWRRSVTATHHFLTPQDIDELFVAIRDIYLGAVNLYVCDINSIPLGFMGLNREDPAMVEMLFVEPSARGKGVGTALLAMARQSLTASPLHRPLRVDVNEQNPEALGFYLSQGFHKTGRSTHDAQGRPFPLLHLAENL